MHFAVYSFIDSPYKAIFYAKRRIIQKRTQTEEPKNLENHCWVGFRMSCGQGTCKFYLAGFHNCCGPCVVLIPPPLHF